EGRTEIARQGLEAFREEADSVVVLDNNSLDRFADQVSFNEAMQVISYMVVTIVQGVVEHLSRSYLSTLTEEIENAAREIEEQNNHAVPVDVQPPETVQASWDLGPVAFDDQGFIGLRSVPIKISSPNHRPPARASSRPAEEAAGRPSRPPSC